MTTVAIIGGGIAGICSAKACLEQQLEVTIFESRPVLGGLWSKHDTPVFENLTTNTSCFETALSDIPPSRLSPAPFLSHDSLCFTRDEMYDYLHGVIDSTPGLRDSARLSTTVVNVKRCEGRFQVFHKPSSGSDRVDMEVFDRLVVASGNLVKPVFPPAKELPGLEQFPDKIMHVHEYNHPTQFRGKRVLVVGGSISGCEAAGDMAEAPDGTGPKSITLNSRTMRYLISKQIHNRLIISSTSTRYHNLRTMAGRYGDKEAIEDLTKEVAGFTNADFGAPPPTGPIKRPFMPGYVPVNDKLLAGSKKGRIQWKIGGLKRITETGAEFLDGSVQEFDKIIFATGYRVELSFLEKEVVDLVLPEGENICNLYDLTFHPEIENVAFVGLFPVGTATPPMFDGQARWAARVLSGDLRTAKKETMWASIKAAKEWRKQPESNYLVKGYECMDRFARHGGFEVNLGTYPELAKGLIFSPVVPAQFRMFGHGKSEQARDECARQLGASGFEIGDRKIGAREMAELHEILEVLENREDCPRGLREAIESLSCEY